LGVVASLAAMASPPTLPTVADLLLARQGDDAVGLLFEDQRWTWAEHVQESLDRAAWLTAQRQEGPWHVGVLLDNVPDFSFLLGAAALSGAVIVGINPTRRGAELERDLAATDCQLVITESRYAGLVGRRGLAVDSPEWVAALGPFRGAPAAAEPNRDGERLLMLIFTSGTSGEPKAVRVTDRKVAGPGVAMVARGSIGRQDVAYVSMPMFHSACVMQAWAPALAAGATMAVRRRFSASGFLPDVRRYGVTYMHYVGKPLAYVLATPEAHDDGDNPLRVAAGNEAAPLDIDRFAARFACEVQDGFGSTEGGVYINRTPDTPPGSLGVAPDGVDILDPDSGAPVPAARFDTAGQLLNADEAIGELVNTSGAGQFAGYYANQEAEAERMRDGMYWSGDLAYRDDAGFIYFAGRTIDWLRVDGENLGAAPIERILARFQPVSQVAVYAVPDALVGDQVMAALRLHHGKSFDPLAFASFLGGQADLGTKWAPRYVRIASTLPVTETNKVLKRVLAVEAWTCDDDVWVRDAISGFYRPITPEERAAPPRGPEAAPAAGSESQ
jgi:fatty-acyl-CoA synthase